MTTASSFAIHRHCPYGHELRPGHVRVGWLTCACDEARESGGHGHTTRECGDCRSERRRVVSYDPPHVPEPTPQERVKAPRATKALHYADFEPLALCPFGHAMEPGAMWVGWRGCRCAWAITGNDGSRGHQLWHCCECRKEERRTACVEPPCRNVRVEGLSG